MTAVAHLLWPEITVLERGWLSANNIVFQAPERDGGAALVHDGPASGAARPVRPAADLPAAVASLAATLAARRNPGETTRALLARLDLAGLWAGTATTDGPEKTT